MWTPLDCKTFDSSNLKCVKKSLNAEKHTKTHRDAYVVIATSAPLYTLYTYLHIHTIIANLFKNKFNLQHGFPQ